MSDSITVRQRIVRHISIDSGQPYAEASGRVPVLADRPGRPERIVIVGGGFAGFHAARTLSRTVNRRRWLRRTGTDQVEIVLISPTDYFLYLPLLPEVAAGILDPRRVAVPLADAGPGVRTVPGTVDEIDIAARSVGFTDPEGIQRTMSYDRLLLTVGSVGKLLPVPGLTEHAIGFRSIREGLALRDHLVRQIELAAAAGVAPAASSSGPDGTPDQAGLQGQARPYGAPSRPGPADPSGPDGAPGRFAAEQDARCTFVVVGAGYTGTEVAAHGQLLTRAVAGNYPALRHQQIRWLLLETAPRVLPELDRHLSATAHRVLTGRGVEIRTGTTIEKAADDGVLTSGGEFVPTRSLIWCVGVRPDPLVGTLGLATSAGRLSVDEYLGVPGHPEIFACGDAAAVPDLTRPGEITAMTAQHAVRQGRRVAGNIAASLGYGRRRPYRHHDLGFTVDLGGAKAAANPAGLRLSGVLAKAVTRGYHLSAIPANKIRIASDWLLDAVLPRQAVQLGLLEEPPRVPSELQHPGQPHQAIGGDGWRTSPTTPSTGPLATRAPRAAARKRRPASNPPHNRARSDASAIASQSAQPKGEPP